MEKQAPFLVAQRNRHTHFAPPPARSFFSLSETPRGAAGWPPFFSLSFLFYRGGLYSAASLGSGTRSRVALSRAAMDRAARVKAWA